MIFEQALTPACETRRILFGPGVLPATAAAFRAQYGDRPAIIVADPTTFEVAGKAVAEAFRAGGKALAAPFVFGSPGLYAEFGFVEELEGALREVDAVPVAVGSGTINDLVKLAAHRVGRPYLAVATAASMDGYTAFGASVTYEGSKQTFSCPAPEVVVADLDVLRAAPPELNAAGYADLLAKVTAGADWLLADAVGEEALDAEAWALAQGELHASLADPEGVRAGGETAVRSLTAGLLASGIAMQRHRTSRPASGAEHQFSHLWDMEGHRHQGKAPLHGFKVGIGTLAVTRLYERLLAAPLEALDVEACVARWAALPAQEAEIRRLFSQAHLEKKAREETAAKWVSADLLREHLRRLRAAWPELRPRLQAQLLPAEETRRRLAAAGAPVTPEEIGLSAERLGESCRKAYFIRRRYTVLDLAVRAGFELGV